MPQLRCPNCGVTINLERRKKLDVGLIIDATKNKPKTFTELLHITELPRKTLSLRLKELCGNGVLVKQGGAYKSNGDYSHEKLHENVGRVLNYKKTKNGMMLIALITMFTVSGFVLGSYVNVTSEPPPPPPKILGNFTMSLNVHEVVDLYAWQAVILYDPTKLVVVDYESGSFYKDEQNYIPLNATDIQPAKRGERRLEINSNERILLLGGTLIGSVMGKSGSGELATITFGYYSVDYDDPKVVAVSNYGYETIGLHSNLEEFQLTLTLTRAESK